MNAGAFIGALGAWGVDLRSMWHHKKPMKRKCLQCGELHGNNNSFCCAEHCKQYREQRKANKVDISC